MRERGGQVSAKMIPTTDKLTVQRVIHSNVLLDAILHTDEHGSYVGLPHKRHSVNHGAKEFKRGNVHTNSIEAVWSVLKRGLYGVYHHVSLKHLALYLDEFAFRLNQGACGRLTMDRIDAMLPGAVGKRITYRELTE